MVLASMSYYTRSRALLERTVADSSSNIPVNALPLEHRVAFEMNRERAEWDDAQVYAACCRRFGCSLVPLLVVTGATLARTCLG